MEYLLFFFQQKATRRVLWGENPSRRGGFLLKSTLKQSKKRFPQRTTAPDEDSLSLPRFSRPVFHGWSMLPHGPCSAVPNADFPRYAMVSPLHRTDALSSLPEFMNFKLFGKTILVVNIKFGLFFGHPLSQ